MTASTAIPACACPHCGYLMDRASAYLMDRASALSGKPKTPKPGDISLCFGCTEVLQFNPDMTQRTLSPTEFLDLPMGMRRGILWFREFHTKMKKH